MDRRVLDQEKKEGLLGSEPIVREFKVKPKSQRRQMTSIFVTLVVLVLGGIVAWLVLQPKDDSYVLSSYTTAQVGKSDLSDSVEVTGNVAVQREDTIVSPAAGMVASVQVEIGDWVGKGQLVAAIQADDLDDDLRDLEATLSSTQREQERSVVQHSFEMKSFDRQQPTLERAVETAQKDYNQTKELFALKARSQTELDAAEDTLEKTKTALEDLKNEREENVSLYDLNQKSYAADISLYQTRIASLKKDIADTKVKSTVAGQVLSVDVQEGSWISQYASLLTIGDVKNPEVIVSVPETQISKVATGQSSVITISGRTYDGTVKRIGATATADSSNYAATVEVRLGFKTVPDNVAPGTSATVDILTGTKTGALVLPRGPFYTSGERSYVYVVGNDGTTATKTQVTYGLILADKVEIASGLKEGDRIVSSTYTDFLSRDTIQLAETGAKK